MKIFIIKVITAALLLTVSATAMAVPAKRITKVITLADGTRKEVVLVGDENRHFYLDADNVAYTCNDEGVFVRGNLSQLQEEWKERLAQRNRHRLQRAQERGMNLVPRVMPQGSGRHRAQWGAEANPISGDKKGLVILVNFPDLTVNQDHGHEFYNGFFNEVGFNKGGNQGSVHDYFYECSYGQFNLTFDVYGPVTVQKSYTYYGKNSSNGEDLYVGELAAEACRLADKMGADFSKYDWDNDGEVDQVYIVYAGYGEHADAGASTIWPHECTLSELYQYGDGPGAITLDGMTVDTYAMSCELDGNSGDDPAGIGTACHEFSHCMCLPDFYDTTNNGYFGMDSWDLMDYGSYSGPHGGGCPAPYTCYERMYCGWLTPTVLSDACEVGEMKPLYEAPEAYIIYNEKNRNEYYMLANYQNLGFGTYNPGHGMLMLHVYFDPEAWTKNTVNSTALQRMTIIPADGRLSSASNCGDTWPGTKGNNALTDTSTPAASLYTANTDGRKLMGKPIENIAESQDGLISFTFNGGVPLAAPEASEATSVTQDGFTANWSAVEGATGYKVQLTATDLEEQQYPLDQFALLSEDFSGFNNRKTSDGSTDLGSSLNAYTKVPGWEGEKLYTTPGNEVKMGTGKANGCIYTPDLTPGKHVVTLVFTARKYGSDNASLSVVFGEGSDYEGEYLGDEIALTADPVRHVITVPVTEDTFWWGLESVKRCYLSEMIAYDGELTEDQIASGTISGKSTDVTYVTTDGTSYQFTGLSPLRSYSYIVCATQGNATSKWSNSVTVLLENEETGLEAIQHSEFMVPNAEANVYDLSGRILHSKPAKGIYIVNGRKIVVK